jgi:hypothetical protein
MFSKALALTAAAVGVTALVAARRKKATKSRDSITPIDQGCTAYVTRDGTVVNVYEHGAVVAEYISSDLAGGVDPDLVINISPDLQAVAYEGMKVEINERGKYGGDPAIINVGLHLIAPSCNWAPLMAGRSSPEVRFSQAGAIIQGVVDIAAMSAAKLGIA